MKGLSGQWLENASLADYTSWRVGGRADVIYTPSSIQDLLLFLTQWPEDKPLLWLGLGSNVLIRDGGFPGAVIITQGGLREMACLDKTVVRAEAGIACAQLARYSARLGLEGLGFMAGIPGTVGGALRMNAGCFGGETWEYVKTVEAIDRAGNLHFRSPKEYEIAYRHVKGPLDEWFVAGHFLLKPGDKNQLVSHIRTLLEKRNASQPTGLPNCGSVFRNPPGDYAARLIEQCGLKNTKMGGAYVSDKHANFIINDGTATAADIEKLIFHVRDQVLAEQSVHLIPEVCMIGKP